MSNSKTDSRKQTEIYKQNVIGRILGVKSEVLRASTNTMASVPLGHNIIGVGYGLKMSGNSHTGDLAVRIYVKKKLPRRLMAHKDLIPPTVNGVMTDVIEEIKIRPRFRCTCGTSVGEFEITSGTLGCILRSNDINDLGRYILSNNHVLANNNLAPLNADILQPGPSDGGSDPRDRIGGLSSFEPLIFSSGAEVPSTSANLIDAAVALLDDASDVDPSVPGIGPISNIIGTVSTTQSVEKSGKASQLTLGVIMDVNASPRVEYGAQFADFTNQIVIQGVGTSFSQDGDSGSLVVDAASRLPIGLLFAGGASLSYANPIGVVLSQFNMAFV